jgi:WD40 repeat protein
MIKSFLFIFISLMLLARINNGQKSTVKSITADATIKGPILWTLDWSPDGKYCAIGGDDGLLRIYEATGFTLLKTHKFATAVQCLDWNQDGKLLAIALDDHPVQLLNIETGQYLILQGTTGSRALAWNNNGAMLATGDYNGLLYIWNKEGKLLKTIKKDNTKTYLSVDWHPKKNILLTGSDRIRLFDTSGNLLQSIKHRSEETIILTVKWHPGGTFFATGDYGHKEERIESLLQFWKEDGTLIKSLSGSKAEYRNIRWNKDGSLLATASDALRIWSRDRQIIYTGKSEDLLWGIDWNSKNENVFSTSAKGNISIWTNKAILVKTIP